MKFFSHYNPPDDCRIANKDASCTLQEFAEETDLNKIMDKYAAGLAPLPVRDGTPIYGDFSNIPDFATAQQIVIDAREKFEALPSRVRAKFDNDPAKLIEFLKDDSNRSEAEALGLIPSKQKDGGAVIGGGDAAVAINPEKSPNDSSGGK